MITRSRATEELDGLLRRHGVVGIIGARQVGKSTLARDYLKGIAGPAHVFDMEDPGVRCLSPRL